MSWLWKSDASSPASFEKALSKLSSQITAANVSLESTRSRGRRIKALWTLYTTLAYLVAILILVLVIGPQAWALPHFAGLVAGPFLIYFVRLGLSTLFDWFVGRQQNHVDSLQKQRDEKIAALKKATKYDSTQELLQKYGGAPSKDTPTKGAAHKEKEQKPVSEPVNRTGLPPPPTANIQPRTIAQLTPQRAHFNSEVTLHGHSPPSSPVVAGEPGFAPNAFTSHPVVEQGPHWYDRILDVLLGEDESSAKNRLVLLCDNCRLVNGQAPPGVKTLEQLGKWRCSSCGAWNNQETEATRLVKEMTESSKAASGGDWEHVSRGDESENQPLEVSNSVNDGDAHGTGAAHELGATKRVTRSANQEPSEGL